jgi:gliding motility-associated-like protein
VDITICDPADIALGGQINGNFLSFEWSSSSGYSNINNLSPLVPVAFTTTFTLSATSVSSNNLLINGDFTGGNSGFTSDYTNNPATNPGGLAEGSYNINTMTPSLWNNCPPLDGNMMVVNGAPILNQNVWCQNVSVMPNTQYVFSTWLQTIILPVPQLSFSINGVQIGSVFSGSSSPCDWQQFFTTWESGGASFATICITNENSVGGGNDFALDDIFFGPVCEDEQSFTVTVDPFILEQPTGGLIDCNNPITTLTATPVPTNNSYIYQWDAVIGNILSIATEQTATVSEGGIYVVTVTNNVTGCTREETYNVVEDITVPELDINGKLNLDCRNNTSLLTFTSSLGIINSIWTLPNGSMIQSASVNASKGGVYKVSVEAANGCIGIDSVLVSVDNAQIIYQTSSSGPITCKVDTASIYIEIFSRVDSVTWSGPGFINQTNFGDTILVSKPGTYIFELHQGENCTFVDSVKIAKLPAMYQYQIQLPETLTCRRNKAWLSLQNVIGVDSIIWWEIGKTMGNGDSLLVDSAGKYYVQVTDPNGCKKTDSISIFADFEKPVFTVEIDSIDCVRQFGQFNVNYSSQGSFFWSGKGTTSDLKNPTFTNEGTYRLIVTGENGCKDSLDVYLPSSVDFPSINSEISHITCKNPKGKIVLSAKPGSLFSWIDGQGNTGFSDTIISNIANTYSVTVTAPSGCKNSTTYDLSMDTLSPVISDIPADKLTCDVLSAKPKVVASNYTNFFWKKDNISIPNVLLEPTFTSPGIYQLELQNANGCITTKSYIVTQDITKPNFVATANDLTCLNPSTTLSLAGDTGTAYLWVQNNQIIQSGLILSQPQIITIQATNDLGCDSILTLEIKGNFDLPVIALPPVLLNCNAPQQWIKDQGNETGLVYAWETDNGTIIKDSVLITQNSNFTLVATNNYGCVSKLTAAITTDFTKPSITIDGPSSIPCKASSIILTGTTNAANPLWTWSDTTGNLGNENSFIVNNTGTYTILVKNLNNGCTEIKNVTIDKQPSPEDFTIDLVQPLCFGDKGILTWTGTTGGTAPYSLTINNNSFKLNKKTELPSGRFILYLKDVNGCDLEKFIEIENPKDFLVEAGRDTIIQLGATHQIKAISDLSWNEVKEILWEPATALSCTDCPYPIASPKTDTEYTITIKDENGCIRNDIVTIRVKNDKGYVAPNIFYPNSGNGNQRFTIYPEYASIQNIKTLKIYDRWGNLVFATQNIPAGDANLGWDGSFDGREINPGVFIWVAELEYKDKSSEIAKGDVTVLR